MGLLFCGWLVACQEPPIACEKPELMLVAERLADCLSADAAPESAIAKLTEWGYTSDALSANLLPFNSTSELIITYRVSLQPYEPQGKLAVLAWQDARWEVAFESPDPQSYEFLDGSDTLEGDWWFEFVQVADMQGDGADDLLFTQRWSNITTTHLAYAKLLTFVNGELRVLLVEDDFRDHEPTYRVDGQTIIAESRLGGATVAMTRTLQIERDRFVVSAETINPAAATHSVTLPDGTQYLTFDGECGNLCVHQYGLYRIRDSEQFRYDTPIFIRTLKQLRDGNVYIGGTGVYRVDDNQLINDFFPIARDEPWHINDMSMTSDGDIWAAGLYKLLHFGREQSEVYDLLAHQVWISADDTVWARGWDGQADGGCCVFRVVEGEVETFLLGEVSAEVAAQLDIEQ